MKTSLAAACTNGLGSAFDPLSGESMAESYRLEKLIFEDSDFEAMGWHDALVWSVVAIPEAFEYVVDLDYIFKWVEPALPLLGLAGHDGF